MARLCLFIIVNLSYIVIVNGITDVGQRLPGDELLLSKIIPWDFKGDFHLRERFDGDIITRIEIKMLLSIEKYIFDLVIRDGGVYSNFVDLSVKFLHLIDIPKRINIYGMKVTPGKSTEDTNDT